MSLDTVVSIFFIIFLFCMQVFAQSPNTISGKNQSNLFFSVPKRTKYIYGGMEVEIAEFPFMVSIQKSHTGFYRHACGGTLIKSNWVMTAAHCLQNETCELRPIEDYLIVAGSTLWNEWSHSSEASIVYRFIVHAHFNCKHYYSDIALIELKDHIGKYLVNLPTQDLFINLQPDQYFTKDCVAPGWGATDYKSEINKKLRKCFLPLKPIQMCIDAYIDVHENQLCTFRKGVDVCFGDSGGPLICENLQIGIVSFGYKCGIYPGVWTRVDSYLPWIKNKLPLKKIKKNQRPGVQAGSTASKSLCSGFFLILYNLVSLENK